MIGLFLLTLRELRARKVVIGLFVVSTAIWIALALALQLDVVDGSLAGARLFGQETIEEPFDPDAPVLDREGTPVLDDDGNVRTQGQRLDFGSTMLEEIVFGAQAFVAGAAYWIGILLALFATGGLVAALTERGQVDVILTKPMSRSQVLAGRLLAVMVVILVLATYLFGAVWLTMSIKSGIWNPRFLLAIGVVFGMFAVVYSVVTLVGVWSGSGPLSFIVTLGVLFISLILSIPGLADQIRRPWRSLVVGADAVFPKFADVGVSVVPQLATAQPVATLTPFLTSLLFGAVCYGLAFVLFARKDF